MIFPNHIYTVYIYSIYISFLFSKTENQSLYALHNKIDKNVHRLTFSSTQRQLGHAGKNE